jgi:hypothetical protein
MAPDGTIGIADRPGLGVELDAAAIGAAVLARFAVGGPGGRDRSAGG